MTPIWLRRLEKSYSVVEEAAGGLCPLLSLLSLVPPLATPQGVALLTLWLGGGHTLLFCHDRCPPVRYRPFLRGLFAFAAGLCWPLWFLLPGRPIGR